MKKLVFAILPLLLSPLVGCSHVSSIDYSKANNWVYQSMSPDHEVDCFYLLPTSWVNDGDEMYCDINNQSLRTRGMEVFNKQASYLKDIVNVYAPFYRQADAAKTLALNVEEQEKAIYDNVPYQDSINAFEYYLNNINKGRPFILAGHSQGSLVLKYILANYMKDHSDVYSRMIAAYPLGYSFEGSYFDKYSHVKFATGEKDLQCVITWNSERLIDGSFGTYNNVCHKGALSINPISWNSNSEEISADDTRNLGSPVTNNKYSTQVIYDYKRNYEVLLVGVGDDSAYDSKGIGDASLHGYDWGFFINNIHQNVIDRCNVYLNK